MTPAHLPDLKLLRIFVAVARHRGFARAQQELNLTTSAISTYMSQLEGQLGFVLCQRGRGGFSLTPKGELLMAEALRLLGELEAFDHYTSALKGDVSGNLNFGVIDSTVTDPALPLTDAIGSFSKKYPAVYLSLFIRSPYELQHGVLDNTYDLAVGAFPTHMNGLMSHPLYREQQWLYCSDQHPLFGEHRITQAQIVEQRVVRRSYWSQSELGRHGFKRSVATVESMEAELILLLSGGYIGYLPEHYAQNWVERGRLRVLLPATFGYQSQFSLILRRGRSREPSIQAMCDLLRPKGRKIA